MPYGIGLYGTDVYAGSSFTVTRQGARPPLELHAEIDTADGLARYRWDANDRNPENRAQNITCGSTLMNGFANAGCSLSRNISRAYPDLGIFDTIRFVGVDGRVAYEGRGSRFPREANTQHRINAEAIGWIAHGRDRSIVWLGIDRDRAAWTPTSARRKDNLLLGGLASHDAESNQDESFSRPELRLVIQGAWTTPRPISLALYTAPPGQKVASVYYDYALSQSGGSWDLRCQIRDTDSQEGAVNQTTPTNLATAASGTGTFTPASPQKFAEWWWQFTADGGADGGQFVARLRDLAVIGTHGLPLTGSTPGGGLLGSEIIKHTAGLAAPLLDTSNVLATAHPIDQAVWRDLTDPYDIWLAANNYERWNLAVWEDRKLYYHPLPDPSEVQTPDWVLRSDHRNGLQRGYDGPTATGEANGAIVRFQNIQTGQADMIDPTTHPSLAVTDTRLAANRAGLQVWQKIQLPNPNTPAGAAKIGAAALAEFNRQRTPGRFQITGHLQDAAGNWHQGWVPRAGETVLLEEDDEDPIRVLYEASWSGRTLTMNADAASKTIDAILADMG